MNKFIKNIIAFSLKNKAFTLRPIRTSPIHKSSSSPNGMGEALKKWSDL